MRKKYLIIINFLFILSLSLISLDSYSEEIHNFFKDGNALEKMIDANARCQNNNNCSPNDAFDQNYLYGYIIGVTDTANMLKICIRKTTTARQIVDTVILFLDKNPSIRDTPAPNIIIAALSDKFPCEN